MLPCPVNKEVGHFPYFRVQVLVTVTSSVEVHPTSMALLTLILVAMCLSAYALYRYLESCRNNKIPTGLKPLPGPKGICSSNLHDFSPVQIRYRI